MGVGLGVGVGVGVRAGGFFPWVATNDTQSPWFSKTPYVCQPPPLHWPVLVGSVGVALGSALACDERPASATAAGSAVTRIPPATSPMYRLRMPKPTRKTSFVTKCRRNRCIPRHQSNLKQPGSRRRRPSRSLHRRLVCRKRATGAASGQRHSDNCRAATPNTSDWLGRARARCSNSARQAANASGEASEPAPASMVEPGRARRPADATDLAAALGYSAPAGKKTTTDPPPAAPTSPGHTRASRAGSASPRRRTESRRRPIERSANPTEPSTHGILPPARWRAPAGTRRAIACARNETRASGSPG